MDILNSLSAHPGYHIEIARRLRSVSAAIVFNDLANLQSWMKREGLAVTNDKWGTNLIPLVVKDIHDRTMVPVTQINNFIRQFEKAGFLEVYLFGMPARRHFRLVGVPE